MILKAGMCPLDPSRTDVKRRLEWDYLRCRPLPSLHLRFASFVMDPSVSSTSSPPSDHPLSWVVSGCIFETTVLAVPA